MDKIDELLRYIHRTNPEMTREKLINELSRSDYASLSISTLSILPFTGSERFKGSFKI